MHSLISLVERKIDGIAMYRTVTLALLFLVAVSLILGTTGLIQVSGVSQLISLVVAVTVGLSTNLFCARLFRVEANHESALITSLILFFLVFPANILFDHHIMALTVAIAILSKYVLAIRKQHIFNAAAFGAVAVSLTGYTQLTWWIGTPELLLPLLVVGSWVVYKIRKWTAVCSFIVVSFAVLLFEAYRFEADLVTQARFYFTSSPALFLAFFMLTEPFTMPPTRKLQAIYGAFIGFLSSTFLFEPLFKMSPELALVIGNAVFYPSTLRRKLFLKLREVNEIAHQTFELTFEKPDGLRFQAGQYLEWTLPHSNPDDRGIRRYFTIASAPNESVVRLGVKGANPASSYKQKLFSLQPGDTVVVSQRAGDFLLPNDTKTKVAFIAGGIGITPFRSFVKEMQLQNEWHDAALFYCTNTVAELAYRDVFEEAAMEASTFRNIFVIAKEDVESPYEHGYITKDIVTVHTPDFLDRTWYLSGPPGMVNVYSTLLRTLGVPKRKIIKDFFPGLA